MTRKEQAAASKATLLEAARTCFTEDGYDATTVSAILDRASMARGALYHYFPGGKAEIFAAVFAQVDAEYHERRDALIGEASPLDRIEGGAAAFVDLCADESFARIALADAPRLVPGQDRLGSSHRLLRSQLAEAVAAGEIDELDVDALTLALYGAIRSAGEHVVAAPDKTAAVTAATAAIRAIIDGLRRR